MEIQNNNNFIGYIILIVSLFILVLFTKQQAYVLVEKFDQKDNLMIEQAELTEKLTQLNSIKKSIQTDGDIVDRYMLDFSEDKIYNYIYEYKNNLPTNQMFIIKNIDIWEAQKNELGFHESSINVSIKIWDDATLKQFLTFLTAKNSQYQFIIESFSFPNEKNSGAYDVNIPLKLLFR